MTRSATAWLLAATAIVSAATGGLAEPRLFPLAPELAGDRDLPPPCGVGLTAHVQKQNLDFVSLAVAPRVAVPGLDFAALVNSAELEIENDLYEINAAADIWVLPFLNVFTLLGYIDGTTRVDVNVPGQSLGFDIDYEGIVYGAGLTLAGGWKSTFASLTATITETDLDVSTSTVSAWVLTPKAGVNLGSTSLYLGAMYQEAEEEHEGDITVDVAGFNVPLRYDVALEQDDPWNYLAGVSLLLDDRWEIDLEGGLGDRTQATLTAKLRF